MTTTKTQVLHFRVTKKEKDLLLDHIQQINSKIQDDEINMNQYLQMIVRNNIALGPHFLRHELEALKETNRALLGLGRNLNQVVKKINSGEFVIDELSETYLKQIAAYVAKSRNQISKIVDCNQKRSGNV